MSDVILALERVPEEPALVIPRSMLLHGKARILGSVASGSFGIYDAERSVLALMGAPRPVDCLPASTPRVVIATSAGFETRAWPMFQWTPLDVLMFEGGKLERDELEGRPRLSTSNVERLSPTLPAAEVDERLRFALQVGQSLGPIYAVRERGEVAAMACCFWRSERYFDISIDTLPGHRGRGLGRAVATALIRDLEPASAVHCSSVDETLARRFIVSLGFRRVGSILRGIPAGAS